MMKNRKDVSDHEVMQHMTAYFERLMKDVVPRRPIKEPEKPPEPDNSSESACKPEPDKNAVTIEEFDLLESIYAEHDLSITKRSARLGLSANKMNILKKSIVGKNMAEEFSVNLGKKHGGIVKMLALTKDGYKTIRKQPIKRPDNVSLEHWWWQQAICRNYQDQEIDAVIEMAMNDTRADIGFVWNDKYIAIEVELSPKNAVSNIVKDLRAGFSKVVCCCKNSLVKKEVKRSFAEYSLDAHRN